MVPHRLPIFTRMLDEKLHTRDSCSLQSSRALSSRDFSISWLFREYHNLARSLRVATGVRWPAIGNATINQSVSHYWRVSFRSRNAGRAQSRNDIQYSQWTTGWCYVHLEIFQDQYTIAHAPAWPWVAARFHRHLIAQVLFVALADTTEKEAHVRLFCTDLSASSVLLRPFGSLSLRSVASKNFSTFLAPVSTSRSRSRVNR